MDDIRKTKKDRKIGRWIIVFFFLSTLGTGAAFASWLSTSPNGTVSADIITRIRQDLLSQEKGADAPMNILLIGSDSRRGENARSDTLIFMRLDFKRKRVYFVSIPRDMRVYVPGRGKDKINAAFAYGQAELAIQAVEGFLGVDLNHYMEVDFEGFKKLVDALGGIDITVDQTINDQSRQFRMYIPKGKQHMSGEVALNYVRYRHGDSDFGRADRQQNFLRALIANTLRLKSIFKLPKLIGIIDKNVGTDMSRRKMLSVANFVGRAPKQKIETITLPGASKSINGISYVEPDRQSIDRILKRIKDGASIKKMKLSGESDKMSLENGLLSISLLNGSGKAGLATFARRRLQKWGLKVGGVSNAASFNYRRTEIRYGAGFQVEAYKVRRLLFKEAIVRPSEKRMTSHIEIILGHDYYLDNKQTTKEVAPGL